MFSKGHSSRGSGSSIASSPVPRESLDLFGGVKRLEDVTEEPQERDEFEGYTLVNDSKYDLSDYDQAFADYHGQPSPPGSPAQPEWSLRDTDDSPWIPSYGSREFKRRKSMDQASATPGHRFSNKFGSISRRWRNRSAAGPQLSIITHLNSPASRSGSLRSSQVLSPALSSLSRHDSLQPSSPILPVASDIPFDGESEPIDIDQRTSEEEEGPGQATTPLLPPLLSELCKREEPVHSPLQSPAIAPTSVLVSSQTSLDRPLSHLPSPPLSTKPSMVSMRNRSRTNTLTNSPYADGSPMPLFEDPVDQWAVRLGHADFTIHPEPYVPETVDLDSYAEYRKNWDQARTNYAKHLARTAEHYGSTSKVYKLTEEKWAFVDEIWKKQHTLMRSALGPMLARLSDGDSEMQDSVASSTVLEKPVTRVILPYIDDTSGKFPQLGDGEIVGPMSVAQPRTMSMSNPGRLGATGSPSFPSHKRNLLKFFSDIFRT